MFGSTVHYDANGKEAGRSSPGLFGSTAHLEINHMINGNLRCLKCFIEKREIY